MSNKIGLPHVPNLHIRETVKHAVDQTKHLVEKNKPLIDGGMNVKKAVTTALTVKAKVGELGAAAKSLRADGFKVGTQKAWAAAKSAATNPKDKLGFLGFAKKAGTAGGAVASAFSTIKDASTAFHDIRQAVRTRTAGDIGKAVDSSLKTVKDGLTTANGALQTARDVQKFRGAYRAAAQAFKAEVPNATKALVHKVGWNVAKTAFSEGRQAVRDVAHSTVRAFTEQAGTSVARLAGTAERSTARALLRGGERAAAHAGVEAAAHAAAGPLARAAGRFAPGVNVALAAYDTYQAVKDVRDPSASVGKKATSVITAVGSIAAATNIPVVSQIGAGISTVSSLVGGFFFSK